MSTRKIKGPLIPIAVPPDVTQCNLQQLARNGFLPIVTARPQDVKILDPSFADHDLLAALVHAARGTSATYVPARVFGEEYLKRLGLRLEAKEPVKAKKPAGS